MIIHDSEFTSPLVMISQGTAEENPRKLHETNISRKKHVTETNIFPIE